MAKPTLTGSFVALVTPFQADGSVDYEGFERLIDFQAAHVTSALLLMGSTGEVSLLEKDERRELISRTVKLKRSGLPLWYGCTANSTAETIGLVKHAAQAGADGAIITVPSYLFPPVEAAVQFVLEVADASDIPIGVYNNPTRVGLDLPAEAIIRLAEHPNIVIDKEATANPGQIGAVLAARKELAVMCCDSPRLSLIPAVMALGGQGTANVTGNVAPAEMAVLSRPWRSSEDALAFKEAYFKLLPLFRFNYCQVNPVPIKSLAWGLGLPAGELRRPYLRMPVEAIRVGVEVVRNLGLCDKYDYRIRKELSIPGMIELPAGESGTMTSGFCFLGA
jgi:4-hydroxy-tetrahydrodipicolinate synthase